MTRAFFSLLVVCLMVSGCSGPIETRIQTHSAFPFTDNSSYTFAKETDQPSKEYNQARQLVQQSLQSRNMRLNDDASILVQFSVSQRPASVAIVAGEGNKIQEIANKKEHKFLQQCDDIEHRFSIGLFRQSDGQKIYSGSAAEYHCNGKLEESLTQLVTSALSELGSAVTANPVRKTIKRSGIE